jgi:hypothetical protein
MAAVATARPARVVTFAAGFLVGALCAVVTPLAAAPLAVWLHERNLARGR